MQTSTLTIKRAKTKSNPKQPLRCHVCMCCFKHALQFFQGERGEMPMHNTSKGEVFFMMKNTFKKHVFVF